MGSFNMLLFPLSPGEGNGNPLQYSCLENPMGRRARQAAVHGVARVGHNLATKPHNHNFPLYFSQHNGERLVKFGFNFFGTIVS